MKHNVLQRGTLCKIAAKKIKTIANFYYTKKINADPSVKKGVKQFLKAIKSKILKDIFKKYN